MQPTVPTSRQLGASLQGLALALAPAVATVFTAGEALGRFVHALNADLADLHRRVLAGPDPVAVHRLAQERLAQELQGHTVAQLRSITGKRSHRLRKADLIAAALAMVAVTV